MKTEVSSLRVLDCRSYRRKGLETAILAHLLAHLALVSANSLRDLTRVRTESGSDRI
jgi:hypothetical protein